MKKIVFSIFILFLTSGCWNYIELNEYSIVTGIAIDKSEDGYKVSTLISNIPKGNNGTENGSSNSDIVVYEGYGKSIAEALKDVGLISPKELYLNSFYTMVISEEVARDGINNVLDFFLKYSSSRNNFNIIIAKNCKAKDTLKIMTSITNYPSQSISDNIKSTSKLQGFVKSINFDELISIILKDGIDPSLSTITIVGNIEDGFTKENLESSEPKAYIKLDNQAIFRGDKLIMFANYSESVGINMINNKINEMVFEVPHNNGFVVIDTIKFHSSIKTSIENNKPVVNIFLNGDARIIETNGKINIEDNDVLSEIQKEANEMIKQYVISAIKISVNNKTDILGIGNKFNQNHPNYFKQVKNNWYETLKYVEFNIYSNLKINSIVSAKNSLEVSYDR